MSVTDQLEAAGGAPLAHGSKKKKSILQFEITKKKVPRKDLMHFSRQLAVFLRAGIPIIDALETIESEVGNKLFKSVLQDIVAQLRGGSTFAAAVAPHTDAFPAYYVGILQSAELTGRLDVVLEQLSDYIEREVEARAKITSALTYPAVIAVVAAVVVVVLVAFVLPRFRTFFADLNAELPLPTRMLLSFSGFLSDWWWAIAGVGFVIICGLLLAMRSERGKTARDRLLFRLPVVGDLIRHVLLERFCRILSSMMQAGVPLTQAMTVTSEATNNAVYRKGLSQAREAMLRGEGLATPLAETGLFPNSARQMFRVGEDTGTLDAQLATAANYFERELDYKIKRFTNLFEPAVIIAMGLVVGFVAIALVSAMYGIFRSANV